MKVSNAFIVPTTGVKVEPWPIPGKSYAVGLSVWEHRRTGLHGAYL
jgi:hypothetical protein